MWSVRLVCAGDGPDGGGGGERGAALCCWAGVAVGRAGEPRWHVGLSVAACMYANSVSGAPKPRDVGYWVPGVHELFYGDALLW